VPVAKLPDPLVDEQRRGALLPAFFRFPRRTKGFGETAGCAPDLRFAGDRSGFDRNPEGIDRTPIVSAANSQSLSVDGTR
jgi:hypothetical protein